MKVTLKTLMAGPEGCVQPGETAEVSAETASDLLRHGFATPADAEAERAARMIESETTEDVRGVETTTQRTRGRR